MRNFHKYGIDTHGRTSGKIKTICPECNATRGHKGNKSFSIDLDKGLMLLPSLRSQVLRAR
ncbi:MAG: hypothetical protein ACLUE2_16495 [Bacteroides cellulosilyticus]